MSRTRIVVTGASGFIGRHLVDKLKKISNVEAIALSRSGAQHTLKISNYALAPDGDVLIHLAEDNNPESVSKQGKQYETEALVTLNLLLNKKYSRVIYASSSVLYGDYSNLPHRTDDRIFINSPYSQLKALAEGYVLDHSSGVVVRIANIYGPGMSNSTVLSNILDQTILQGSLIVRDSAPIRDFIWIDDVVDGILRLAFEPFSENLPSQIYNLGTGLGTSIGDLARHVLDLAGQSERKVVSKSDSRTLSTIILDYSKTTLACGWTPKKILHDGLAELVTSRLGNRK